MLHPGARNLITDVTGLRVGNATDDVLGSGTTVLLCDEPAMISGDIRGGAPGTREAGLLDPSCLVERADAVVLSGGSAFGLDAVQGVMDALRLSGRGFPVGSVRVPIVPGVILMDLLAEGDKDWGERSPYAALGRRALASADLNFELGRVGAGRGATCGDRLGGLGSVSAVSDDGLEVGALFAVNGVGSAYLPGTDTLWAWPFEQNGELGHQQPPQAPVTLEPHFPASPTVGGNTTIGVVATNAPLTKAQCERVAIMAHDGMARAIRPVHTPFDGDSIFVVATGTAPAPWSVVGPRELARIGAVAADCVARAIGRGMFLASSR